MIPLRLIAGHWRRSWLRTLLTALSVAVAVFLFCTLRALITSLEASVAGARSERLVVSNAVSLFANLRVSMLPRIASMPGVRSVVHWTWFGGIYVDHAHFFPRFAVDVPGFRDVYGDRVPGGAVYKMSPREWQDFERERTACIVGAELARQYGFTHGSRITIQGDIYPVDLTFTVRGIYESDDPAYDEMVLFFHWAYLDESVGRRGACSTFGLDLEEGADPGKVSRRIDDHFRASATPTVTQTEQAFQSQFLSMWGNVHLLFNAIGSVVLAACFLITLNTMLMAARERVAEVGVLKTLGFPAGAVAGLYLAEAMALALAGGLLGTGLARLWADGGLLRLGPVYLPSFLLEDGTMAAALGLAAGLGILAGLAPALAAARLSPTAALRSGG